MKAPKPQAEILVQPTPENKDGRPTAPEHGFFAMRVMPGKSLPDVTAYVPTTPPPSNPSTSANYHGVEPRFVTIRLSNVVDHDKGQEMVELVQGIADKLKKPHKDTNRSKKANAHHVGIWSKVSNVPFLSQDTAGQPSDIKAQLDRLFEMLGEHVCKPILAFLEKADPKYYLMIKRYV